ncbi:pseudouridine synthase [Roseateles terrae]|uniref:Dual-specificity RNA pseudouridine synthase RluA n=1 Tax=Roseateles terrae TaxID=431060 RepID=A0ABR6GQ17_9BURK|nr:pseudouridine synthase [Roseateles terrae]MBB3194207.1 tRNA pseudouridine32 synthase/23S rRNA pseudouridine746 synthase [Roseateles terrae]OWQ88056.1 RNA pseudouridine synthase [Roseateles terrae]
MSNDLPLMHVDAQRIIIHKPAGLLAVPGRGEDKQDCAWHRVRDVFADALVVHRLDQATSGLLVFARGEAMQRALSDAFAQRQVDKRYEAVVSGRVDRDQFDIDLPLIADWPNRPRQKVDFDIGKPSLTRVTVVARDPQGQSSRLWLEPVTGRSHQLRVHLMACGHPILGDTLYAAEEVQAQAPRLLLHARDLSLPALLGEAALTLHCPVDF